MQKLFKLKGEEGKTSYTKKEGTTIHHFTL